MTTEAKEDTKDLLEPSKEAEEQDNQATEVKETEKKPNPPEAKEPAKEDPPGEEEAVTLERVRENVRAHDEALKEDREDLAFAETQLQNIHEDILKGLPDIVANGKSIYEMTAKEFENVIVQTFEVHDRDKAREMVSEARAARDKYLDEAKKYAPVTQKFQADAEAHRNKEWLAAEKELKALYPGIEKYGNQIREHAVKELQENKVLAARVNQGVVAKFRYLMGVAKELGIEAELTKAELKAEQGNREKTAAGKGKSSSASEARETAYTAERIRKMTLEEYRAEKDKIKATVPKAKK